MEKDPLDKVFETPEESLAFYLKAMPPSLFAVFEREFMRRPKPKYYQCPNCGSDSKDYHEADCPANPHNAA